MKIRKNDNLHRDCPALGPLWLYVLAAAALALMVSPAACSGAGINVVVDGSFEIPLRYDGAVLRRFPSSEASYRASQAAGAARAWTPLDAQGWFAEGPDASGAQIVAGDAHSGSRSLCVTAVSAPVSVVSSLASRVDAGPVALSAWVRTRGADASIDLDLANDWRQIARRSASVRRSVPLPANASQWTRVTINAPAGSPLAAVCRLSVRSGTVWLDDVQIEQAAAASPFNICPSEWIRLGISGVPSSDLPQFRASQGGEIELDAVNESRAPISGRTSIWIGPWNRPHDRLLGVIDGSTFAAGAVRAFRIPMGTFAAGAYVATSTVESGGQTLADGASDFFPLAMTGGSVTDGSVAAVDALRFVVAPKTLPRDLFGVNNGMLGTGKGDWFSGYDPQEYVDGGALGIACTRGHYSDDLGYAAAMGAMEYHAMAFDDGPGPFVNIDDVRGAASATPGVNPAFPKYLDLSDPAGFAKLLARADATGRWLAARPLIASYQMANESPYLNGGRLCPSPAADADFRQWCRDRYKTLDAVNDLWNTHYSRWDDIEQIVSARFLEEAKSQPQATGAAAVDWTASLAHLSDAVVDRMRKNPGQAMDWLRFRTAVTLRAYEAFHDAVKRLSPSTLISTNLCWPAFNPQTTMEFYPKMDVTMVDICYTAGLPRGLGTPCEMMDSLEMAETCAPDKPVWGIETYYQPQWPAEYMALQNWGLLAHGMTNNLVFDWKPYSDAGPVKSARAWEAPKAPPMWFIIDKDGTKLPGYGAYVRSHEEIRAYDVKYDGLRIKRAPANVAFYVSLDTAQYVEMQTGSKPWGSPWQVTRNNLVYLLRMNGVAIDYVDDNTLPSSPGQFNTIVVPASCVLSQQAASRLARFAQAGGAVVLAGMSGVCDPWLRKYPNIGGPAWADLRWTAPDFEPAAAAVSFGGLEEKRAFAGVDIGRMPAADPIDDDAGRLIGWRRPWGKGKLVAYGVFPARYNPDPHSPPALDGWAKQMIALAGLPVSARWIASGAFETGATGAGSPVVEIVVRQKGPDDRFVFCLNQGGAGDGAVSVATGTSGWTAADALTGEKLAGEANSGGQWTAPMHLDAFGYRVIHLVRSR